jgi:outer membrane protein OmpA-like peptidoglycan-associated protein
VDSLAKSGRAAPPLPVPSRAMSDSTQRPTLLANLLLMLIVGAALFVFFAFIKGCGKKSDNTVAKTEPAKPAASDTKAEPPKPKLTPEEQARAVAKANEVRPKSGPVSADPAERERTRQLLLDTGPRKPFTEVPKEFQPVQQTPMPATPAGPAVASTPPAGPATPSAPTGDAPPAPEPVREVAASSPEGAALLADATARIDEAPPDLYSDKAKTKVRDGLKNARRIFKVHTVFFEKGGAITQDKDVEELTKSLEASTLQEAMADPRSVFFVLGFADKSGAPDTNKKLSVSRADAVIALLRDKCGVLNFTYPVAVGSTEIVAPENKEKNRAAEVWLVLP